jgi:isopropylmalate/homocitrate/citramalate synthase
MRLAEALVDAGLRHIQVAWLSTPRGTAGLAEEIAHLHSLAPDVTVYAIGASKDQLDAGIDAGIDVFQVYGPSIAAFHVLTGAYGRLILRAHWRGEDWRKTVKYPRNEDEYLEFMQEQVAYVTSRGAKAAVFSSMLHYATPEYLTKLAKAAAEAGAVELSLGDGASGMGPEAWAAAVRILRDNAPDVEAGLHCHSAFGLAMANTTSGFHAGATIAEVSVNGLCTSPQADTAEIAAAMEVLYGVHTGVELGKLTGLKRLVEDITGVLMAPNKPVTGDMAWTYTEESIREETQYAPVHKAAEPELFGNVSRYMLGNHSGWFSVLSKLHELGLDVDASVVPDILDTVKAEMLVRGRGLGDEEVANIGVAHGARPLAEAS